MNIRKVLFSIFSITLLIGCSSEYTKKLINYDHERASLIITDVDIFNGKDNMIIKSQDVIIENGKILNIIDHQPTRNLTNYTEIKGNGKTLIPGMIDAHVHLSGSGSVPWESVSVDEAYNLSAYLYVGVTTVYDLGGLAGDLEKLANKVANDEIIGPSIYHTHIPITVKDGHPIPLTKEILPWPLKSMVNAISPTIDNPNDAPKLIENYTKKEVDYVKVIYDQIPPGAPEMSYGQLEAIIKASHKKGYNVFVHIGSPQNAIDAAKAGADVLAHGVWRGQLTPEQADTIASFNIPMIYTLTAFQNVNQISEGHYQPNNLDTTLVPQKVLNPVTKEHGLDIIQKPAMYGFFTDVHSHSKYMIPNFKLLKERGITIIVGTDSSLPGTYAGATFIQEIFELSKNGISNFDILSGATYLSSKLFLDNPDFGTVEIGKTANLLLLDRNPLITLETLKTPNSIILKGQLIRRNTQ